MKKDVIFNLINIDKHTTALTQEAMGAIEQQCAKHKAVKAGSSWKGGVNPFKCKAGSPVEDSTDNHSEDESLIFQNLIIFQKELCHKNGQTSVLNTFCS